MSTLSEIEIEKILAGYEPWLHFTAQQKYPSFPEDDMVQEAMISMWKELQKYDSSSVPLDAILKKRALWRMSSIAKAKALRTIELESALDMEDYSAASLLENAEFKSHRQEIVDILNEYLTFKQKLFMAAKYVYRCNSLELHELFGYNPHKPIGEKTQQKMQKSLEHLESMVR